MVAKRSKKGGHNSNYGRGTFMVPSMAADGSIGWSVKPSATTEPYPSTTPPTGVHTWGADTTMPLKEYESDFPALSGPSTKLPVAPSPEEQPWSQQSTIAEKDVESQPVENFEVRQVSPTAESSTSFSSTEFNLVDVSIPTSSSSPPNSWPDISNPLVPQSVQQETWADALIPFIEQPVTQNAWEATSAPVVPQTVSQTTWDVQPVSAVPQIETQKSYAAVTTPRTQQANSPKKAPLTKKSVEQNGGWTEPGADWGPMAPLPEPESQAWVDPTPAKTEADLLKERVDAACKGWPWTGVPDKLVTLAPYSLNEHHPQGVLKLPKVDQESPIVKGLVRYNDIAFTFLREVFKHHSSLWALSATCQQMFQVISGLIDIWDMTEGYFNNCDNDPKDGSVADPFHAGSVSAHLVITPQRRPQGPATYVEQMTNLRSLGVSVLNFGSSLRNVHFHRVPFLNINVLELLIPQMSKLEILGIYNCQLMHLGTGLKLLDILKMDRLKGKEHSVSLDFYPMYHLGPDEVEHYVGQYGVSWDNTQMDTRRAIWSLAKRIIEKARAQNIDLMSPHTMFRQWLEKTPCWKVKATLNSFWFPDVKGIEIAAMVEYPLTRGDPEGFKKHLCYTVAPKWWDRMFYCMDCGYNQLGVFFSTLDQPIRLQNRRRLAIERCYGCRLTYALRREYDHYKDNKRFIIREWLSELKFEEDNSGPVPKVKKTREWNRNDLRKAVEVDYYMHDIEQLAADLDGLRQRDMTIVSEDNPHPYDRETKERQRPLHISETRGLTGTGGRAPDVLKEKEFERITLNPVGADNVQWYRRDRYTGHGLHV